MLKVQCVVCVVVNIALMSVALMSVALLSVALLSVALLTCHRLYHARVRIRKQKWYDSTPWARAIIAAQPSTLNSLSPPSCLVLPGKSVRPLATPITSCLQIRKGVSADDTAAELSIPASKISHPTLQVFSDTFLEQLG